MIRIVACATIAATCMNAYAVYKCTDPKGGKVTYSDAPCPNAQTDTKMQWAPRANTNTVVPAVGRRQTDPNGNTDAPAEAAALMDLYRRWIDAEKLAGATGRIALSGPVAALQELKRQVIALPVPSCLAEAKTSLVSLIVKSADAHLEFMLKNELASMLYNLVDREKAIGSFEGALSLARCGR